MTKGRIFNISLFPTYEISIDFNQPKLYISELVDLTNAVEKECPVGKYFGVSGIGEGIVWKCVTPGYTESKFWFKVKGNLHSVSKIRSLASIYPEKVKNQDEFVRNTVTENRLNQGIEYLKEQGHDPSDKKVIGIFIKWVIGDIEKEETDTMELSDIKIKDIRGLIGNHARKWLIRQTT